MTEKHVEKGIHKNSNLAESEALDDEFIKVLKGASRPRLPKKAPDWVKKNVINNYKKQHRYLILWYDVKVKFTEYKEALFGTGRGLEIALASTIILLILGGITYYQYRKPQSSPIGIIANQVTPAIKVTPNSSDAPIATPSLIETISPDIAKSPENNKENNQQAITKNDTKPRKPEEPKGLYKENDKIAMNTEPRSISKTRGNSINKNNKNAVSERLTLSNLVYVAVMDLKIGKQEVNSIDVEIKEELIKAINENGKWELSSEKDDKTQAIFYKQNADGALVLFDKKERTPFWEDLNYIENYKKDKNYIKSIVKMLENHKGESPQKK